MTASSDITLSEAFRAIRKIYCTADMPTLTLDAIEQALMRLELLETGTEFTSAGGKLVTFEPDPEVPGRELPTTHPVKLSTRLHAFRMKLEPGGGFRNVIIPPTIRRNVFAELIALQRHASRMEAEREEIRKLTQTTIDKLTAALNEEK
jgi:hypothetical protein